MCVGAISSSRAAQTLSFFSFVFQLMQPCSSLNGLLVSLQALLHFVFLQFILFF